MTIYSEDNDKTENPEFLIVFNYEPDSTDEWDSFLKKKIRIAKAIGLNVKEEREDENQNIIDVTIQGNKSNAEHFAFYKRMSL